jgi:hypothetical protein
MTLLAKSTFAAIAAADASRQLGGRRTMGNTAAKGLKRGDGEYKDRKAGSIALGLQTLAAQKDTDAERFIMEVRRKGWKLDDLFDAFNMAVYRGRTDI